MTKTKYPQVSLITQTVVEGGVSVGCKEYRTDASRAPLPVLRNLRSRGNSLSGKL